MKSGHFFKYCFLLTIFFNFYTAKMVLGQDIEKSKYVVKEKLPVPFGTLVTMDIEIVDGIELNDKDHQSSFLFRIKSVDSIALTKSVIMEFKDETGEFPADEFQLYKYLYGKKKETVSSDIAVKIKKNYVGKTFKVVAYETGEFTGIPNGYFEYLPVRQDYGFHFRHYIIAVANVTNKTN